MLAAALALLASACGADDAAGPGAGSTDTTGASSPAEAVTQAEADEAMGGLCDIASGAVTSTDDILEAFHARAHETLHRVATAAQATQPPLAGALLEAKSVVETDLEQAPFPDTLRGDVQNLMGAFADALLEIGLVPADCLLPA